MKSREARRHEARCLALWMLGAVAGLFVLYVLAEGPPTAGSGGLGPLLGAGIGASLTYLFTRSQRREEETQRRRTLATGLLSEIRLLEPVLRDIHDDTTAAYRVMEPFQTAMYDQAGANLLLFKPETVHALNLFYNGVHELRTTLARYRMQYPDPRNLEQRYPPPDQEHTYVRLMATNILDVIPDVVTRLHKDEGGQWPDRLPLFRYRLMGSRLEVPALTPSVFEDQK